MRTTKVPRASKGEVEQGPLLLTVEQAAAALNISRTRVFELLRDGRLASVKLGRSTRIRSVDIDAFVSSLVSRSAALLSRRAGQ